MVESCEKRIDLEFYSSDIPVKVLPQIKQNYTCIIPENDVVKNWVGKKITYRLPNGSDQEKIGTVALGNQAQALHSLLEMCILDIDGNKDIGSILEIPPYVIKEIENSMDNNAPGPDLTIETTCPECNSHISFSFSLQDFFFGEVAINRRQLYKEIHYLAYHYHWSENELLSLTRNKRRDYISILSDEIERLNDDQN